MYNTFLNIVATDLLKRYGTDLSHTVVVFPNKRASMFLNEELINTAPSHTLWSPRYITISELFRKHSQLVVADNIKLVSELHSVYRQVSGSDESLDAFFSWGELLLSDFDDVDKNMADARLVFENTAEIHEYDSVPYLKEEQKEALKRFFSNFSDNHDAVLKKRFEEMWNRLGTIYTTFREHLLRQDIAYEGMLYRHVVENTDFNTSPITTANGVERYIFVGFNLLQKVEQQLFRSIQASDNVEAHFYWDYDEYYLNDNEAGQYIKQHLKTFGPLPTSPGGEDKNMSLFTKPKNISFINASTEDIQARYVSQWLTPERIKAGRHTAIVLCNESLLPTVINCLPPAVTHVNITTGYPLSETPITTLVQQIFALESIGKAKENGKLRLKQVNSILRHPYTQYISPLSNDLMQKLNEQHIFFPTIDDIAADDNLRRVFEPYLEPPLTPPKEGDCAREGEELLFIADKLMWICKTIAQSPSFTSEVAQSPSSRGVRGGFFSESLYRMYTLISRLRSLIADDGLDINRSTFQRLTMEAIRSTTIPFHGEPIEGIQIMGVLETRNLDFDHLLILSCNEGNMPRGVNDASFIPHSIRKAYGLTTVENKVSIYSYYFHRLLQRATDIEIAYNSSTDDGQMGEKSRFMLQLIAEFPQPIQMKTFNAHLSPCLSERKTITKTATVAERLNSISSLSPTAINQYLRCPLQFFYNTVCGIADNDTDSDSDIDIDNRIFGLIFHKAAEIIYSEFKGKTVPASIFESLIKDTRKVQAAIDKAIKIELFKIPEDKADSTTMPKLGGNEILQRNIISRLMRQLLDYDRRHAPVHICDLEKRVRHNIRFTTADSKERTLNIRGTIDRLDIVTTDGASLMRIVDYKTGNAPQPTLACIEDIFDPARIDKHSDYYLQTALYGIIEQDRQSQSQSQSHPLLSPALLYPSHSHNETYDPVLTFGDRYKRNPVVIDQEFSNKFIALVQSLLRDIFDLSKPFTPTPHVKRCEKCAYAGICGK